MTGLTGLTPLATGLGELATVATVATAEAAPLGIGDLVDPVVLQNDDDGNGFIVALVLFAVGLYLVYDGFTDWQEMRLIQDTPTEKIRSAAVGRTELNGTGEPIGEPLDRPFGDGPCLVATYEIEEWEEDHDDEHHNDGHWSTVESGALVDAFEVDDGTGTMRVEPDENATFEIDSEHQRRIRVRPGDETPAAVTQFLRDHADQDVPPSDGVKGFLFAEDRRYTERWIPPETDLYLLGSAEPNDVGTGSNADMLTLQRDSASDEFIVSEQNEDELVSERKQGAPLKVVGGLALSAITLYFLLGMTGVA